MLLLSPQRAALALGTQCANPTGQGEEALLEMLRLLTPRVEDALNVKTLSRVTCEDRFAFFPYSPARYYPYRLSNGFLTANPVIAGFFDSDGVAITVPTFADKELGTFSVDSYSFDREVTIKATYTSGFDIPPAGEGVHADPNYRVAIGVPDWMSGVVADMLVHWRRNNILTPQVTKEYGFLPTLNEAVLRDIKGRIYARYMRPRADMHWSAAYTVI